jgi:hypothetical protein
MGTTLRRTKSRKWPGVKFARHHRTKRMIDDPSSSAKASLDCTPKL